MPPNPNNVEEEIITESGVHIFFYTNGAMHLLRDREDVDSGIWLDRIDTEELKDGLKRNRNLENLGFEQFLRVVLSRDV